MLKPFNIIRPWGQFRQFTREEPVTVKLHFVKRGEQMSLQYHHKRSEFWHVISGTPTITIKDRIMKAKVGDEYYVEMNEKHRIAAPDGDVQILEIIQGTFDEEDIVRVQDQYGRTQES